MEVNIKGGGKLVKTIEKGARGIRMAHHTDILKALKDDREYYGGLGTHYFSNSDIGELLKNPKFFRKNRQDTVAFAKGRYFHQLILEPEKVKNFKTIDVSSRNTKLYKSKAENGIILLKKEAEEMKELADKMLANVDFFDMIREKDNEYESPMIKEIKGAMWKGKADIVNKNVIIDLKTTSDINKFKWSSREYNYDSQAYIYEQLFGKPLIFLVVDKNTHALGLFEPTVEFLEKGERKVEQAMEVYNTFFGANPKEDIDNYYINEQLT